MEELGVGAPSAPLSLMERVRLLEQRTATCDCKETQSLLKQLVDKCSFLEDRLMILEKEIGVTEMKPTADQELHNLESGSERMEESDSDDDESSASAPAELEVDLKPLQCKICVSIFSTQLDLAEHYTSNHHCDLYNAPFKLPPRPSQPPPGSSSTLCRRTCPECGKLYKTAVVMKRHLESVHGESRFSCDVCGRLFQRSDRLKHHIRQAHTNTTGGGKPKPRSKRKKTWRGSTQRRTCPECGKVYGTVTVMQRHLRSTHGGESFPCPVSDCEHVSNRMDVLKVHVKRAHGPDALALLIPTAHTSTTPGPGRSQALHTN